MSYHGDRSYSPSSTAVMTEVIVPSQLSCQEWLGSLHSRDDRGDTTFPPILPGVVGFYDYCQRHSDLAGAGLIVKMLNDIYTAFDVLTDLDRNPDVYKVCLRIC